MQDAMLDVRIAGVQSPTASTLHLHNTKLISDKENTKVSLPIVARGSFLKKYKIKLHIFKLCLYFCIKLFSQECAHFLLKLFWPPSIFNERLVHL